jgi:sugar O-acyltransferase (sialic acid O-acetyltransferase NeuD family)
MKDLVIVGHGGLARETAFLVEEINRARPTWKLLGYVASQPDDVGTTIGQHPIWGTDDQLSASARELAVVVAIGTAAIVQRLHERFAANSRLTIPSLVHPAVTGDWRRIQMGPGNLVLNDASFTTDIVVGACNVFNPGCTVAHDCRLGSYCLIGPGANLAGEVTLGDRVLVGTGARVLPGRRVGSDITIGAGAVVTQDLATPGVYVGVPARGRE